MLPKAKTRFTLATSALLLISIISSALSFASCSGSKIPVGTDSVEFTEQITENSYLDAETETDMRSYYESVIAALEKQLLDEKQDRYISDYEYEARLKALREELSLLIFPGSNSKPNNNNTGNTSDTTSTDKVPTVTLKVEETLPPETEAPSSSNDQMSFRYGVVNGGITIYEYLGGSTTVAIPTVIDGKRVTTIADDAFKNSNVTTVVIPPSVTSIGWFAFAGCSSLRSISIPASVKSIGYAAFDGCKDLTVLCTQNSYAAQYAASFGMNYQTI